MGLEPYEFEFVVALIRSYCLAGLAIGWCLGALVRQMIHSAQPWVKREQEKSRKKKEDELTGDSIRMCNNCGQDRPYPTRAGRWEYCLDPAVVELKGGKREWIPVTIKQTEEGREIWPDGEDEPMWWPSDAMWRKI